MIEDAEVEALADAIHRLCEGRPGMIVIQALAAVLVRALAEMPEALREEFDTVAFFDAIERDIEQAVADDRKGLQ
jgi:hypothetical protein